MKINVLFIYVFIFSSCMMSPVKGKHKVKEYSKGKPIQYNFSNPDTTLILHSSLTEISGLAYYKAANTLITVNDEDGIYFELNAVTGEIIGQQQFHDPGDYEGIEVVGEDIYIAKSNGRIYHMSEGKQEIYKTRLSTANDVEGLGYHKDKHQLLVVCKGETLDDELKKSTKAVYSFNLEEKKLKKKPYLLIKRKDVSAFLKKKEASEKVLARSKYFSPSGIAVHPFNNHIYILSARRSMMLVLNKEHELVQSVFFDRDKNPQPEGICFSPDGTLYISTEGQQRSGKIFIYQPVKK